MAPFLDGPRVNSKLPRISHDLRGLVGLADDKICMGAEVDGTLLLPKRRWGT